MSDNSSTFIRHPLWILGAKSDLFIFILAPLWILPIGLAISHRIPPETLGIYLLGFGGFGHHLPGFIRAYCDRDLFRRFKLRFTLVPALLLLVGGLFSFLSLNALIFATIVWGIWHGAMQVFGFLRIYDSKARSFGPATARLDWLMCLAWFGLAIFHSPGKMVSLVMPFYGSGGPLLPPQAFAILRHLWDFSTVLITLLFAWNAYRQAKAGTPPSPVKILALGTSVAFWWYCTVTTRSLLLGVLLWEAFHDVQYNALVWLFQRRRVDGQFGVGAVETFLFRPGAGRLALYAALILAYGYLGVVSSFADFNMPEKIMQAGGALPWLLRATLVSALLHFYYDGFIWKVRERDTQRGLTLEENRTALPQPAPSPFFRHGWKWAFFAVPIAYLGLAQYRGWSADINSQVVNLAEAVPESWLANFLAGTYYKGQGLLEPAVRHYRLAVQYNPGLPEGHLFLGDLLYKEGNLTEALDQYRRTVELDPANADARSNLAYLYLQDNQALLATEQFGAALALRKDDSDLTFGMASALMQQNRLAEAEVYLAQTLHLSPRHSRALDYMGLIRDSGDRTADAIEYYRKSLEADSANADARLNLAAALVKAKDGHTGQSPAP